MVVTLQQDGAKGRGSACCTAFVIDACAWRTPRFRGDGLAGAELTAWTWPSTPSNRSFMSAVRTGAHPSQRPGQFSAGGQSVPRRAANAVRHIVEHSIKDPNLAALVA